MHITFQKVILHNFLSYAHSEFDLTDKGYCLVSGVNNCAADNALSNGSGKSSFTSAICWALTGQTINGVTQQIKNIFVDEKSCYVTLEFKVNGDSYVVTRFKEPKSDLKIFINKEDKSGKGLRESEALLTQYLPDLTANLLASIVILGQGLPGKFTNNTPSGRKEVLEKLSKSDFMIADLKTRINSRADALCEAIRKVDDKILAANSKKELLQSQLEKANADLAEHEKPHDFESEISKYTTEIENLNNLISQHNSTISEKSEQANSFGKSLASVLEQQAAEVADENDAFSSFHAKYLELKSNLDGNINALNIEIKKLKAITDVCPTCGQKLPHVHKPDTQQQEQQLATFQAEKQRIDEKYAANKAEHESSLKQINESYQKIIQQYRNNIDEVQGIISQRQKEKLLNENTLIQLQQKLLQVQSDQSNYLKKLRELKNAITSYESSIKILDQELLYNNTEKDTLGGHLDVINQMNTLIKRDFRGVLLSNIISFIDKKAKEYSQEVFGTDRLDFKLDGNDINIQYCNKIFESLSGGEKQKVDLIIQFAIRDMMSRYLNFSSNILVLDEITDNLDSISCTNILNLISTTLDDVESIFIISHRTSDLQIPADSELFIVKGKDGISYKAS